MNKTYLSITMGELTLALPLTHVHKVARMVAISPVGKGAPNGMLGVVNLGGRVVPLFDPRVRLGLETKELDTADHIIFAWAKKRLIGLWVDEAGEVFRASSESEDFTAGGEGVAFIAPGEDIWKNLQGIAGVAPLADGMAVVRDLDAFLSAEDEQELDAAMQALDAETAQPQVGREKVR